MSHLSVIGTLDSVDPFSVRTRPGDLFQATVFLDLMPNMTLMVNDPAVMDALLAELSRARDWLFEEVTGQAPLPVDPEPVGDTGLTLHPLPVGVA